MAPLNVTLVRKNVNVNTAHYDDDDVKNDIVGYHFQSNCMNDRNTDSQSESIEF